MPLRGSVSRLISNVKLGRESAAHQLFGRYYPRLLGLARSRMEPASRRVMDEEDVAVTAFQSFLRRTNEGQYPDLQGRADLWRLLATITTRKAVTAINRERCDKRGGGKVRTSSALACEGDEGVEIALKELASSDPDPQLVVMMNDSLDHMLSMLKDDELRTIALAKLHGARNQEIAEKTERSLPTIERRLRLIRDVWRDILLQSDEE